MKIRILAIATLVALALHGRAAEGYTMFWLTETISGTTAGPFVNKPGNRIRAGGREWTILAAQPGRILFSDPVAQKYYGPYDLVLQRIVELGDAAFSFSRVEPFKGDDPSADIAARTSPAPRPRDSTIERPKRWDPEPLPGSNPAEHVAKPSAFSLETRIRPPAVVAWFEPLREVKYDWWVGEYAGSGGDKTETTRYGVSGTWRNWFVEASLASGGETSGTLVPDGAFLSNLGLANGSGSALRGGYLHTFVIDGNWNGNIGGCLAYETMDYDLRATVYTRQGSVVAPVAEGEEGTAESGATYTFENYEDEVEMSELSMTFIGGIDYTSEFWGVGVYFTLDLYTDTSFSGAVAVRDESFDLSAERTHPIGVAASAWYSPFADYLVAASASTGAETAIRVAFGKFF